MSTEDEHAAKPGEDPPPKYISALVGSINDAAKSAQTSALFLSFLGVYLAATAISISDVDLLRGATIQVSQLGGVNIPIIATFLLGPIVFLVLHAQLLIRYRKLVIAVRLFCGELKKLTYTDRARCRELLANVDLVLMLAGRDDRSTNTWIYQWAVFVGVVLLPVAVLLTVQISFLRYQSVGITMAHRVVLFADLGMVVWFYHWLWSSGCESARSIGQRLGVLTAYAVVPLGLIALNFGYLNVPAAESRTVRYYDYPVNCRYRLWDRLWRQPLDLLVCPELNWGCRYLNLSSRVLVVEKPSNDAAKTLRLGEGDVDDALDSMIGVSASNRNLRFANFNQSQAYRIDLSSSDLRGATFWNASLQGAKLAYADLRGTNLELAHLQNADLFTANLANLSEKTKVPPDDQDVINSCPDYEPNADPRKTSLFRADLAGAKLQGAKLWNANLAAAQLEGANLFQAGLQRATLNRARLALADLRQAKIFQTNWNMVDPDLADFSDADSCSTPEDETKLAKELREAPDSCARKRIEDQAKHDRSIRVKNGGCRGSGDLENIPKKHWDDDSFAKEYCQRYSSLNLATATAVANHIVNIMLTNHKDLQGQSEEDSKCHWSEPDTEVTDRYAKIACCLNRLSADGKPEFNRYLQDKLAIVIADCRRSNRYSPC